MGIFDTARVADRRNTSPLPSMSEPDPELGELAPQRSWQQGATPSASRERLGRDMFEDPLLADITIVCADGKEMIVHGFVLLSCDYFKSAFKSGLEEARTKRFKFENSAADSYLNFNYDVLHRMVEFMYCGAYTEYPYEEGGTIEKNMCLHIDLCAVADYFGVGELKDYVTLRVSQVLDNWDSVTPALPEIITALYTKPKPTVFSIRAMFTDILAKVSRELENDKAFCDFLQDFGECCMDIMREMNKGRSEITGAFRTVCHHCKQKFVVELIDDHTDAYCTRCGKINYNRALRRRAV